MIFNIDVNYQPDMFLDFLKIISSGIIGLIPFFYNVLTEKKRNEKEIRNQRINIFYDYLQNYYQTTVSFYFSTSENSKDKEEIKNAIFNSRKNFRDYIPKVKKYFTHKEFEIINKIKNELLAIDQKSIANLDGKEFDSCSLSEAGRAHKELTEILSNYL